MSTVRSSRRDRAVLVLSLVLTLVFGALACASRLRDQKNDTPPQGWWEERGPVVAHDTFPSDCTLCHAGDDWQTIRDDFDYDHAAETGVALVGPHERAECLRCHNDRGPVAAFAQRGCRGCHEDVHRGQLGTHCAGCHDDTRSGWRPEGSVAEHNRTRFQLVGAHAAAPCWRCHEGAQVGNFTTTSVECVSCHAADLARATSPNHVAMGYTESCERCHIPTGWTGADFTHATWPLTGAHAATACTACHAGGTFAGTPRDCFSCHANEYNNTTDPGHMAASFPTSCELCHNTTSWFGAFFNHGIWPLTGAHASASCTACHAGGVFTGTPRDCFSCHANEYNNTTDPDHAASAFPTSCELCHGTSTWEGASFNHRFPISGGPHGSLDCTDCHLTPGSASFSCTHCHAHDQSRMADKHSEVRNYVWESGACLSCHPNGRH